jgi:hypothetical protein
MSIARARYSAWWIPICARQLFIAHCSRSGASFISVSIVSSSPERSSPSGRFATRSAVSAQPALATTGSGSADQATRSVLGPPELTREVLLGLQPLRDRPQPAEVHAVIVTAFLVHLARLGVLQRGQLGQHLSHIGIVSVRTYISQTRS